MSVRVLAFGDGNQPILPLIPNWSFYSQSQC